MTVPHRPTPNYGTRILTLFVLATCVKVWLDTGIPEREAQAQIPNAGAQRRELVKSAAETNRVLNEILTHLKTGALNVTVVPGPTKKGG